MGSPRILIIEDHVPTQWLLRSILTRRGYEVTAAGTLAEGLDLLDGEPPPDCIVLDLDLPDGRGEALLLQIRERHLPVRVAVCSGTADDRRWDAVRRLAPEGLFRKPIDVDSLCAACG
jgi:DNA-binding NtrC family response regulator